MTDWRLPSSSRKSTRKPDNDGSLQRESSSSSYKPPPDDEELSAHSNIKNPSPHSFGHSDVKSSLLQVGEEEMDNRTLGDTEPSGTLDGHRLDSITTFSSQTFIPKDPQPQSSLHEHAAPVSSAMDGAKDDIHEELSPLKVDQSHSPDDAIFRRPADRLTEIRTVAAIEKPTVSLAQAAPEPQAVSASRYQRPTFSDSTYSTVEPASSEPAENLEIHQQQEEEAAASIQQPLPLQQNEERTLARQTVAALPTVSALAQVYQRDEAGPRVQSVRQGLDDALEEWWMESKLPPKSLLRNGLLVLQAGHTLDEAHRTLLLRTALRYRRGMVTALFYQTDPDRTAYLMKEALLFEKDPLPTKTLWHLLREDGDSEEWKMLLEDDLLYNLDSLSLQRHQLATATLHQLNSDVLLTGAELESAATILTAKSNAMNWNAGRLFLLLLLLPVIAGVYSLRAQRADLTGMATIPEGTYITGQVSWEIPENTFFVKAFAIEQTEVTNQSYRLCVQQRGCDPPSDNGSNTRPQYFLDPIYDRYPVVNVDWMMARQYCEWSGKRLPTEVEWEIAASVAPATQRRFDYPWGNTFLQQYANSRLSDIADTKEVGTYHPAGTTPTGATDMAGNVAEWTTSRDSIPLYRVRENQTFVVKGGSFIDAPALLRSSTNLLLGSTTTEPWIGFRCAVTLPEKEAS